MAFSTASPSDYRFARITPHDHSATLWIITILSPIYATLVLGVRLGYTKWRAYSVDDLLIVLAHIVGTGMWIILLTSIGHGLGKSYDILDDVDILRVQQTFFATRILLYIALAFSKSSILILISDVFGRMPKVTYTANATIAFLAIWGISGVISVPLGCKIESIIPKSGFNHCVHSIPWIQALTIIDIITELFTVLTPLLGLYRNKMHVEDKAVVMVAFFTRIPNVVFSLIHMIAYSKFVKERQTAIQVVPTVVWQSTLLCYSLISATTPTLKGFTQGFKTTGLSIEYARDPVTGELSGARTSIALNPLTSKSSSNASPNGTVLQAHSMSIQDNSTENYKTATLVSRSRDGLRCCRDESSSIASCESRQVMIKQEWRVSDSYRL
ncbi:hypothetical protein COCMIDRAFT_35735 [Bipolaris oryzae ATCC 44560]|uniref:Rhodopsin domain-containing protein n=1 Tax=Bipolaris oryzae ATCC 44560 TaxID=930090 RepID=W6ZGI9_COCMI|nr:uncharacterized protein COCMIDRAFT_35735 [Bipolaris oryzae ATCC 44560]EUC46624.1 hypothetical protein COCMIDRAFT_35735 [Bipolaris oryzae ATCC 44560]